MGRRMRGKGLLLAKLLVKEAQCNLCGMLDHSLIFTLTWRWVEDGQRKPRRRGICLDVLQLNTGL